MESFIEKSTNGFFKLRVWIQPGSKKNEVVEVREGFLKVKIKAPPVEGKANRELIKFLSSLLKIKTRDIEIKSGQKSRRKIILIKAKNPSLEYLGFKAKEV